MGRVSLVIPELREIQAHLVRITLDLLELVQMDYLVWLVPQVTQVTQVLQVGLIFVGMHMPIGNRFVPLLNHSLNH